MNSKILLGVVASVFALFFTISPAFAQTAYTGEQVTLSEDLANNPLAQDILQKIEQTKQWIAELEQRNYDNIEKQQELDSKRAQALKKLNEDLAEWEKLWEYYSPRNSFERFVDKIPDSQVKDVFWDQFEFKEQKVNAGREALKQVISNGGSLRDGIQAYRVASETKRIELIEANSQFNVNRNLAYYNQQILFDINGKFVDSPITGEQLRKYYEDYRTNPAYLNANPDDAVSWDELSKTSPNTECREGQVVIHRFHADDYVCITMSTAEMWIQRGMGEIVGDSQDPFQQQPSVTPLTKCDDGFSVIFNKNTEKYSCVLDNTANTWIEQGIAEFHDSEEFIMKSIKQKESALKIEEINQQIRDMERDLENKKIELKKEYDKKYDELLEQSKIEEKNATKYYNEHTDMSKEELSTKIIKIREDYEDDKEDILKDKVGDIRELEKEHEQQMADMVQSYEFDPYIKIVLNSGSTGYEAVLKK